MSRLTESDDFDIRYSEADDESSLRKWLNYPAMLNNFPMEKEENVNLVLRNWIGFFKYKSSLTATYKGKPVGIATLFLMPYKKVAHHSMMYFVVDPEMQRKGIGSSLMRNIKHLAKSRFKIEGIHLDVYSGMPGKPFLETCGFESLFEQEKFVKEQGGNYRSRFVMEARL